MKKIFSLFYTALCHFSLAFSGILIFFWSIMKKTQYIDHENISSFLTFAVIFGVSSLVFAIPRFPYFLKVIVHFIINTASFVFNLAFVDGITTLRLFIVSVIFALLYFVVFALVKLFEGLANGKKKSE